MRYYLRPDTFLHKLNSNLIITDDGIARRIFNSERMNTRKLIFTQDTDLIIEGPCSWEAMFEFKSMQHFISHRQDELGRPEIKVLVFSECCGNYISWNQEELTEVFPEATFFFPYTVDYCGDTDLHLDGLAKDLCAAGILGTVDI